MDQRAHAIPLFCQRRRRILRLAFTGTVALIVAVLPAMGSADVSEPVTAPSDPGAAALSSPLLHTEPADGARTSTASERQRSRSVHRHETDAQALAALRQSFKRTLATQFFPDLVFRPGQRVDRYLGRHTAVVSDGHGPGLLVESELPLQARRGGKLKPLDSGLVQDAAGFRASNAVVETSLPLDIADGIEFSDLGVAVAPATEAPAAPTQVADKLFYANTDIDTDILAAPTPLGVDLIYQLRSSVSPQQHVLEFDLPAGATLAETSRGVEVRSGGDILLNVANPSAWDAEGTAVPAHYELDGTTIRLVVEHQNRDLLYPLLVDPLVENYWN